MLKVKNICKNYDHKSILDHVSFNIPKGKVCALLGLNGAGKSTLMKIICNLFFPDKGYVEADGEIVRNNQSGKIGYMIENPCFYKGLSGKQNLKALSFLYDGIDNERIDHVLTTVGLFSHKDVSVKKYSLGMKQRLYFAYAILNKPKILVLDEPFRSLDPVTVDLFKNLIRNYADSGCTVLISGHTITDIQDIGDCALILDRGQLIYEDYDIKGKDLLSIFLSMVSTSGESQ